MRAAILRRTDMPETHLKTSLCEFLSSNYSRGAFGVHMAVCNFNYLFSLYGILDSRNHFIYVLINICLRGFNNSNPSIQ